MSGRDTAVFLPHKGGFIVKQFSKLSGVAAVMLAALALQVQIQDDVSLSGEAFTRTLQWTPGVAGSTLALDKVTVDTAVKGHAGVLASTAENNTITVRNSAIKGGDTGYALRFDSVTGSQIRVENTDLSTKGGRSHIYQNTLLSDSSVTLKDSSLTGGARGFFVENAGHGSEITLDNTSIGDTGDSGALVSTMTGSVLNITNSSVIAGEESGLYMKLLTGAMLNILKGSTITGGGTGAFLTYLTGRSCVNISESAFTGQQYGIQVYAMTDSAFDLMNTSAVSTDGVALYLGQAVSSSLSIVHATLTGKEYGLLAELNDSEMTIESSVFTAEDGIDLRGHDSNIAITGTQTTSLLMNGSRQTVDIADSGLGNVEISGQFTIPEDTKGDNLFNITTSKLTELFIGAGGGGAGRNTVNLSDSEVISEGNAITFQDTSNNIINIRNSSIRGYIHNSVDDDGSGEPTGGIINLDNSHFEGRW
ncbi:hypothetical protein D3S22_24545 [Salmonella enterica]|nr:hypothetical protein [Salmonella enterica]EBM2642193.1 hypothetical protein [Salmonella enterica]EBN9575654.1 hypothetical protein [Salmonella enterica]